MKMNNQTKDLLGVAKSTAVTVVVASAISFAIDRVFTPENGKAVVNKVKTAKDVIARKLPITITIGGK